MNKPNPPGMPGKLLSNSAFLIGNDILTRLTTFILYALTARFLGAHQFGQLSLALTMLFTFQILAPAGLRLFVTREIAEDLKKTDLYFVNGSFIAVFFSAVAYLVLLAIILALNYSRQTAMVIFLVSLGLLPFSLSTICEAIFQGWERMQYIAYANAPRNLGVIIAAFLLLSRGYGIDAIAWTVSLSYLFLFVVEWWLVVRFITRPHLKINLKFSVEITKKSLSFLGFQGTVAILTTVTMIILSKFTSEAEVGYYNAASQILAPLVMIINSIVLSAFPVMCRKFDPDARRLKLLSENLIEVLFFITLPVVICLVYLAEDVLLLLYGNQDFLSAVLVLRITLFTLIFRAVTTVLGRDLLAGHREKSVFKIVFINAVSNIALGFVLIRQFGLLGAAIAAVVFTLLDFVLHVINVSDLWPNPTPWQRFWKPLVAGGFLAVFLVFVNIPNAFLAVLIGLSVYGLIWLLLSIWAEGNLANLKQKYRLLWSE